MNSGRWIHRPLGRLTSVVGTGLQMRVEETRQRQNQRLRVVEEDVLRVQAAVEQDQRFRLAGAGEESARVAGWDQPVRPAVGDEQRRGRDAIDDTGERRRWPQGYGY